MGSDGPNTTWNSRANRPRAMSHAPPAVAFASSWCDLPLVAVGDPCPQASFGHKHPDRLGRPIPAVARESPRARARRLPGRHLLADQNRCSRSRGLGDPREHTVGDPHRPERRVAPQQPAGVPAETNDGEAIVDRRDVVWHRGGGRQGDRARAKRSRDNPPMAHDLPDREESGGGRGPLASGGNPGPKERPTRAQEHQRMRPQAQFDPSACSSDAHRGRRDPSRDGTFTTAQEDLHPNR